MFCMLYLFIVLISSPFLKYGAWIGQVRGFLFGTFVPPCAFRDLQESLVPNSFLLLVVRHLLLEAMHLFLVASCY